MKQRFEIKPECMSYERDELQIETNNHLFEIKDKRVLCISADRLTVIKNRINSKPQADKKSVS